MDNLVRHLKSIIIAVLRVARESMPDQFGDKLRYLRRRHKLTQADLARWLKLVSQSHISYLESRRKAPSLDLVLRVAEVFGVSPDYLLRASIPAELAVLPPATPATDQDAAPQVRLLGAKLHALRRTHGWTQWDVAQRVAPTTQAYISLLEAGQKTPSPDLVLQLADVFGVTTAYLLCDRIPIEIVDERSDR
jgi:transcriptional regulator with XRE-family HTH domain